MKDPSLFVVAVASFCSSNAAAFVPTKPYLLPQRATIQVNGYRNEWGEGGGGTSRGDDASTNRPRARPSQQVPLLGPIPGAPPLLLGGEMTLDPPTPLQWQALEESVILHQQYLKEQGGNATTAGACSQTTGVDAAPLVAVIDNITGKGTSGRYATLAAVVGISSSQKSSGVTLDTSDETSFMESLNQVRTQRSPLNSCIRLVGVGRASLKEFLYKLPTNLHEEGHYDDDDQDDDDDDDDDDDEDVVVEAEHNDEDDHDDEEEQQTPIVMAEFTLLRDAFVSSTAEEKRLGEKGARSLNCSPVHAIAEMSKLHNRVIYLHEDRRRLVKGLKVAKARLENKMMFEDHDGIGQATSLDGEEIVQEFLQRYDHDHEVLPTLDTSVLSTKENYGLNYYSAFSSIPQLTNVALQSLEPYYSPERRSGEEHEMEIASFVAFRALDGFCTPQDMAWALQCTNTIERFHTAYSIMYHHKLLLEKMAEYASHDLRDCGEECTDIF